MSLLLLYLTAGVPSLQDLSLMIWGGADVITEIRSTINVTSLNHPQTIPTPSPWKNCLLWNQFLVPKGTGAIVSHYFFFFLYYSFALFCSFEKTRIHTLKIEMQSKRISAWEYPSEGDLWQYRAAIPSIFLKIVFLY